jgi:hypothetical protein
VLAGVFSLMGIVYHIYDERSAQGSEWWLVANKLQKFTAAIPPDTFGRL